MFDKFFPLELRESADDDDLGDLPDPALDDEEPEFLAWDPEAEVAAELEAAESAPLTEGKRLSAQEKAAKLTAAIAAKATKAKAVLQGQQERAAARDKAKAAAATLRAQQAEQRKALAAQNKAERQAVSDAAKARNKSVRDSLHRDTSGKFSASDRAGSAPNLNEGGTDTDEDFAGLPEEVATGFRGFLAGLRNAFTAKQQQESGASELLGDFVPLTEAGKGDTIDVRIIKPGWGSSGYYTPAALKAAADSKVFHEGLHSYWDHPTKDEERNRPERSLRDLAGTLAGDAVWKENGAGGPGLYAPIRVAAPFRETVRDLAPDIGVSIRASGKASHGEMDGRKGPIIEAIVGAKSVDFVTAPGAGGRILSLFESAGSRANSEGGNMGELEEARRELTETASKLTTTERELTEARTALAREREAAVIREAADVIMAELTSVKDMLPATKARIVESFKGSVPMKDGKLDTPALKVAISEAVAAERKYFETITGAGSVRGMGSSFTESGSSGGSDTPKAGEMEEAFKRLGLSESQAKIAANGRG